MVDLSHLAEAVSFAMLGNISLKNICLALSPTKLTCNNWDHVTRCITQTK